MLYVYASSFMIASSNMPTMLHPNGIVTVALRGEKLVFTQHPSLNLYVNSLRWEFKCKRWCLILIFSRSFWPTPDIFNSNQQVQRNAIYCSLHDTNHQITYGTQHRKLVIFIMIAIINRPLRLRKPKNPINIFAPNVWIYFLSSSG